MNRLLISLLALFSVSSAASGDDPWVSAKHEYKNFPLFLRYPAKLNVEELKPQFPMRIIVTLKFSKALDNGLPEAAYNRTLEELDEFVVKHLSKDGRAQCVLVETFGGKRIFYAYAKDSSTASELKDELKRRYSQHDLRIEAESDPSWSFLRSYATEYRLFER